MIAMKYVVNRVRCDQLRERYVSFMYHKLQLEWRRFYVSKRLIPKVQPAITEPTAEGDGHYWPRKIFSGIQPTGDLHLGNYLGAVRKWTKLQDAREDVTFCIVDLHSITLPQNPAALHEQIFKMAATMLACGIDPDQSTLFVQSAVKEHSELCWLLGTLSTMAKLGHLPQYKEKTRQMKEIPLGLFVYPVLQAADILLYKATHIPVGEDQVQHIQLTQHLAKTFNTRFGRTFPICHAVIDNKQVSRIRSLRDPTKKMSKSDPDPKSAIYVADEPELIIEKVKKAVTDFCSDVSYEPETRLGVSNLIAIHSYVSGQPIHKIIDEARNMDTGKYKLRVADAIIEHLKPIREKIKTYSENRSELIKILDNGAEKANNTACVTIEEVKQKMGLGAPYLPLFVDLKRGAAFGGNGAPSSGSGNTNITSGTSPDATILSESGETDSVQWPRQNMSAVVMATTAVNAQTGGSASAFQINKLNMGGFGRPLPTMAFRQVQNVGCNQTPEPDHTVEQETPKDENTMHRPIVPQQKVRIEKEKPPTDMNAFSGKLTNSAVKSMTENLLSPTLLQRTSAPPSPPPSPLQALLPQYQQQVQEHLEHQAAQQEQQQQQVQDAQERKARRSSAVTNCTETAFVINDRSFMATSALTVTRPMPTNLAVTPGKPKKPASTTLSENVSAAVSPIAEVKAAVAAANAEHLLQNAATRNFGFLSKTTTIKATTQLKQQQPTAIRNLITLSNQLNMPTLPSYCASSLSFSSSLSTTSSDPHKNAETPKTVSGQLFVKLIVYGLLAIGASFGGAYYFWREVLQTFFDEKRNRGD